MTKDVGRSELIQPRSVLVVVVTYFSESWIEECIDHLRASATELSITICVVDNDSGDSTAQRAESLGVRVVQMGRNSGYSAAVNAGVEENARHDFVLFMNPDVLVDENTVQQLLEPFKNDDMVGATGPSLRSIDSNGSVADHERCPSGRRCVSPITFALHWFLEERRPRNRFTTYYYNERRPQPPDNVDWLSGSCQMIRYDLWASIGGMDEKYFMFFEDVSLGLAVRRHGFRNAVLPGASVQHALGASVARQTKTWKLRRHIGGAAVFYATDYWFHVTQRLRTRS